jgi:hypothetical protein
MVMIPQLKQGLISMDLSLRDDDCVSSSLSEVFSANARDLYVYLDLMGSFVMFCTSTVWN